MCESCHLLDSSLHSDQVQHYKEEPGGEGERIPQRDSRGLHLGDEQQDIWHGIKRPLRDGGLG